MGAKPSKTAANLLRFVEIIAEHAATNAPALAEILTWSRSHCESSVCGGVCLGA